MSDEQPDTHSATDAEPHGDTPTALDTQEAEDAPYPQPSTQPGYTMGSERKPYQAWCVEFLNIRDEQKKRNLPKRDWTTAKKFCAEHTPVINRTHFSRRLASLRVNLSGADLSKVTNRVLLELKENKSKLAAALLHSHAPQAVETLLVGMTATKMIAVGDGKGEQHLEEHDDIPTAVKAAGMILDRAGHSPQVAQLNVTQMQQMNVAVSPLFAGEVVGDAQGMFNNPEDKHPNEEVINE